MNQCSSCEEWQLPADQRGGGGAGAGAAPDAAHHGPAGLRLLALLDALRGVPTPHPGTPESAVTQSSVLVGIGSHCQLGANHFGLDCCLLQLGSKSY